MDLILQTPPLLKILAAFLVMLAGIKFRLGLGLSILLGAVLLGILFAIPPMKWLEAAGYGLSQQKTLCLAAIVALIMILNRTLEQSGQSKRLMNSLAGLLEKPRTALFFFPALIGLLPMPGGAVFSAPMVESASTGLDIPRQDKALINYWSRHVWELAWPLYPGIILASSLAGIPIAELVFLCLPGPVLSIALGWFFFLRPGVLAIPGRAPAEGGNKFNPGRALAEGAPLLVAIVGGLGLEIVMSAFFPGSAYDLGVVAALALAVCLAAIQNRFSLKQMAAILLSRHILSMTFVVAAIFVFKEILSQTGAVAQMAEMTGGTAALIAAAVLLPFLVGLVSGITLAFVGACFPLLLGLIADMGLGDKTTSFLMLGLFSGFSGVMVSPIHLCLILTCQYFKTDLAAAWRRLIIPSLLLLIAGVIYFLILR